MTSVAQDAAFPQSPRPAALRARQLAGALFRHGLFLVIAVASLGAYEHFRINGQSPQAIGGLVSAVGFGLLPVRALARELLAVERKFLHMAHAVSGLALLALSLGGVISGRPVLDHAALAPFAIMGAAQALMHQDRPRSHEQAEALRRFATSLPEVQRFTRSGDLTSPSNVRRAVAVLTDLMAKAQALGETELRSDPGFQAALRRATMRFGLSVGLDTADQAIGKLSTNPAAARDLPELRQRLRAARKTLEK